MLHSRLIFMLLASMLATPVFVAADSKTDCKDVNKADVMKWVDQIKEYELTAKMKMEGALIEFESRIYGRTPDRLRVDLDMGDDKNSINQKTIFDGKYQWSAASSKLGSQITKLQLDKAATKNKPFDTFMYIMGSGLINGEDLPMTIKTLFEVYKVSPKCDKKNKLVFFSGQLDTNKYRKYISESKYAKQRKLGVDKYAENFGHVQISVDPKSHAVKSYAMGKSADNPTYIVEFENIKINSKLFADTFTYKVPAGVEAIDITDDLIKNLH